MNAVTLHQAAESPCIWVVRRDPKDSSVKIEPVPTFMRRQVAEVRLQTDTGVLVGTNRGEYGGGLLLTDARGATLKNLLSENVLRLLPVESGVLIFTGLLHLGADHGRVWLYNKRGDGVSAIKKLFDLDGYPLVIANEGGDVLLVTGHGVSRIDQQLKLEEIASLPFAQTLPNSISQDAIGRIYIGMNGLIVRLIPTKSGYTHEWFTRSGCLQ